MAPVAPAPMLARLEAELPIGAYSYEPKWDGFRCLAERAPSGVALHGRHGRPLGRYFPEVAAAVEALPPGTAVDGELVERGPVGRLSGSAGRWDPATMALDWAPLRVPRVSTPVTWAEVEEGAAGAPLAFGPAEALARLERVGDLHAPVLAGGQRLPVAAAPASPLPPG